MNKRHPCILILLTLAFTLTLYPINGLTATSAWKAEGKEICGEPGNQYASDAVPDGSGGVIAVWEDYRSGVWDIYAQRVDADGILLWAEEGVPVCTATGNQLNPAVCLSDSGGVIIVWEDNRGVDGDFNIYAQKLDMSGAPQWQNNGIAVNIYADDQDNPRVVPDGAGGAIIIWSDYPTDLSGLYAQRIDAAGTILRLLRILISSASTCVDLFRGTDEARSAVQDPVLLIILP